MQQTDKEILSNIIHIIDTIWHTSKLKLHEDYDIHVEKTITKIHKGLHNIYCSRKSTLVTTIPARSSKITTCPYFVG